MKKVFEKLLLLYWIISHIIYAFLLGDINVGAGTIFFNLVIFILGIIVVYKNIDRSSIRWWMVLIYLFVILYPILLLGLSMLTLALFFL